MLDRDLSMKVVLSIFMIAKSENASKNLPKNNAMADCRNPAAVEQQIAGTNTDSCDLLVKLKRLFQPWRTPCLRFWPVDSV